MNKNVLIGVIAAVIIALGGGYWYMSKDGSDIEALALQHLKNYNINAEAVDHSIFSDTTTLTNVSYNIEFSDGTNLSLSAKKFAIKDLDYQILASTEELPRVFDGISYENLIIELTKDDTTIISSVAYGEHGAYYQNIAKLVEAFEQEAWSKEFFTTLLTFESNDNISERAEFILKDGQKTYVTMRMLEGFSDIPEVGKQETTLEGMHFIIGENEAFVDIDSMAAKQTMDPEFYGEVLSLLVKAVLLEFNLIDDVNKNALWMEQQELNEELLEKIAELQSIPADVHVMVEGIKVRAPQFAPDGDIVSIKSFESTKKLDGKLENSFIMTDLLVTQAVMPSIHGAPKEFLTSMKIHETFNPEDTKWVWDYELDSNIVYLKGNNTLLTNSSVIPSIVSFQNEEDIEKIDLVSATVKIKDKGLLPILFVFFKEMTNTPVPILIDQSKATLQSAHAPTPELQEAIIALQIAVLSMIEKPGTLDVSLDFAKPYNLYRMDIPTDFTFKAETTQGSETLLDLTTELEENSK